MNIFRFDLNLLKVFDTIYKEQSVTRAARRLNLSQSAVSNALNRLRGQLDDELFVSTGRGVSPTGKARLIEPSVAEALSLIDQHLFTGAFDPLDCSESFQLALGEYTAHLAGPSIVRRLQSEAPKAELHLLPTARGDMQDLIARGDVLAAVLPQRSVEPPLQAERLMESEYVIAGRRGNPLLQKRMSIEEYCAAPHVAIAVDGYEQEEVDRALARLGMHRRIICTMNHLSLGGQLVRETDALFTVTRSYLKLFAPWLEIARWPLPVEIRPFVVSLVNRPNIAVGDAGRWFIGLVREELVQAYAE